MQYLIVEKDDDPYEEYNRRVFTVRDHKEFFEDLKKWMKNPSFKKTIPLFSTYVCNQILKNNIRRKLYLPAVDCDCEEDKQACFTFLHRNHLDFALVQSSYFNHYWFIIDKLSSMFECLNLMGRCPGDKRYRRMCQRDYKIVLRAVPKNGYTPSILGIYKHYNNKIDILPSTWLDNYRESGFDNWVYQFKMYWEQFNAQKIFTELESPKILSETSEFDFLLLDF